MKTDEQLVAEFQSGNMAALSELRIRVAAVVQNQINRYISGPGHISRAALEAKADELLIAAAKSYRPDKGAAFRTHLFNYLRRLDRYVKANANVAHVPEAKANQITYFQNQIAVLHDQKNRPPTDEELADHMSWPIGDVRRMRNSLRREVPWSVMQGTQDQSMEQARIQLVLDDVYFELTPDEKSVFDHLFGLHGKKKLEKGQDIARETKFSQAKVSQLRSKIADRIRPHLGISTPAVM